MTDKKVVDSICIDIYVGLKEGYYLDQHNIEELKSYLQRICDRGLCVCVIPCSYIYKNGNEDGAIVRLINYPRFPTNIMDLKSKAIKITKELRDVFCQYRISIQAPDKTYMVGDN